MRIRENDFYKELEKDGFKLISMVGKSYKGYNNYTFSAKDIIIEREGYNSIISYILLSTYFLKLFLKLYI